MGALRSFISLAVIVLVVLFGMFLGVDNATSVPLAFFGWQSIPLPMFVWVMIAFTLGGLGGFTLAGGFGLRRRVQTRRLRRDLDATRREVKDLRQIALEE